MRWTPGGRRRPAARSGCWPPTTTITVTSGATCCSRCSTRSRRTIASCPPSGKPSRVRPARGGRAPRHPPPHPPPPHPAPLPPPPQHPPRGPPPARGGGGHKHPPPPPAEGQLRAVVDP